MDAATTLPVPFSRAGETAPFAPLDHYWIGATPDGTVYSSRVRSAIPASDPEYQAWLMAGFVPTVAGTLADIYAALLPYGIILSIDLRAYAATALQTKFAAGETFNVAASGSPAINILCDGTNDTRADLGLLIQYGQDNPTGTRTWVDNNGVASDLTGAQFVTLATLAGMWISDCYPVLGSLLSGIASGKVTKTSDIDAALAAVTA